MPYIDFSLTTDQEITKESLRETVPRSLLSPDLKLGKDHRTWNKKQLRALKVVLCNIIRYGENRSCTLLYSRKKESISYKEQLHLKLEGKKKFKSAAHRKAVHAAKASGKR